MFTINTRFLLTGLLSASFSSEVNLAWASPSLNLSARQVLLPAGWNSLGCYSDSIPRMLRITAPYVWDLNSIESCLGFCTQAGYNYAGVENGKECYCDNIIRSPLNPTNAAYCNTTCTGNKMDFCGGVWKINIFTHTPPVQVDPGWSSLGCYTDSLSSPALRSAGYKSVGNMSIESCLAFCTLAGYKYAGVEYGEQCYCDNIIRSPDSPANVADCNMLCTGNTAEFCGGVYRINIFSHTPPVRVDPGWSSLGCYTDSNSSRTLRTAAHLSAGNMTIGSCLEFCGPAGYKYAGVEYGSQCYCDNTISAPGAPVKSDDCITPCTGNTTDICGAANRINIFSRLSPTSNTTSTKSRSSNHVKDVVFSGVPTALGAIIIAIYLGV